MRSTVLVALRVVVMPACVDRRGDTPRPGGADTTTGAMEPPSLDTLFAIARRPNDAWVHGDSGAFAQDLSGNFVDFKSGFRVDKVGLVSMVGRSRCTVRSWDLGDPQMAMIDSNVYVLSYSGTFDG